LKLPSPLSALFLDVGGTILRPGISVGSAYSSALERTGVTLSPDGLDRVFMEEFSARKRLSRASKGTAYGATREEARAFWHSVFMATLPPELKEHPLVNKAFEEVYSYFGEARAWALFPDTMPFLKELRRRQIPVIIVSNWDARLPQLLDSLGVTPWVQKVVGSFQVGSEKPAPDIFIAAHQSLKAPVAFNQILHVGDNDHEDGEGARALDIAFIRVDRNQENSSDSVVTTLLDILERI
jgi:putative hydrolase of the HAD superfamily